MLLAKGDFYTFSTDEGFACRLKEGVLVRSVDVTAEHRAHIQFVLPGDIFGLDALYGQKVSPSYFEALTDCQIEARWDVSAAEERDSLALQFTRMLELAEVYSKTIVMERVSGFLLWAIKTPLAMMGPEPDRYVVSISHEQLAECVRTRRENMTKVLGDLQAMGALRLSYRRIEVVNSSILREVADSITPQL